ncbi:unnamed protein product [Prunus armeniaca]|uniref:FBD domain-containing protein n=1 Tax=Prunus armeniaca TaxID=36596 RepID=A0A6J5VI26_PRUAR|nr:unnamed protein product [Prunus armeniaca]
MVEDLFLNEATIKALFREGAMPAPLENVHYPGLKIESFNDELVLAMTSVFDMEYWTMQNLDFYQLKKLTIGCYNYDLNGVVLAKYIFQCAQNLKEFAIYPYRA